MTKRSVLLSILVAALLFGVAASGCHRNRPNRPADRPPPRESRRDARHAAAPPVRGVRPAEVLSASAYRPRPQPPAREYLAQAPSPLPPVRQQGVYTTSRNLDRVHEPLPEPVPVHHLFPDYPAVHSSQTASAPVPQQRVYPGPEFTMAQAALPAIAPAQEGHPVAPAMVPAVRPEMFAAPIPELEPVRYRRVAETAPAPASRCLCS